ADYAQWEADRERAPARKRSAPTPAAPAPAPPKAKRLSYREQREWEGMEAAVLAAEARVEAARRQAEDPQVATDAAALHERCAALATAEEEVDRLYARWTELEAKTH
ncbi:MAG: ABC transporter ATP-binding protein, partial [Thermoanaerobaculia bacterium]|nr:ABC transporter ATP-binding protein [Thermoanaerobaculia bacterium]